MTLTTLQAKWMMEHVRASRAGEANASLIELFLRDLERLDRPDGETSEYLMVAELAKRFRVHPKTICRWCAQGRFRGAWQTGNGYWRIPYQAVEAFELVKGRP